MTTITKLMVDERYAVDEEGFLYKMQPGGVARPLRPIVARRGEAQHVYFQVKIGKKTVQFNQDTLKKMQHNAIGRIVV